MSILVTGGAGFIGSHTVVELLNRDYDVVIIDNLCNSNAKAIERIKQITRKSPVFYQKDVRDEAALEEIFTKENIEAVIHFAGLKAVGESVAKPLEYYRNNLESTLALCEVMRRHDCKSFIFSSSATVYGDPASVPIDESFPLHTTNPYGSTKLMIEDMLRDIAAADPEWKIILLRYFNPVGAHESGLIGEDPKGIPNNLTPYITQVAIGKLKELSVFGNDYDTPDGTGVRDYIHVVDLAKGHVAALERIGVMPGGAEVYNLGTGEGYSVMQVLSAFEKAIGAPIAYRIAPRRPGDIAQCYAATEKAEKYLHWKAEKGIDEMCRDAWNWQKNNPRGYAD
ncbi:MAG: UDP-glucose 4-epimerase GalE [Lachnospiraceae bacterium]|nr:UDP-glucose 4-epimerase GalE [Lachnospiraceae bacterium]